ncbi:MAG: sulfotransferase, partial [Desulfobacterales bacterium]|nr:sulfotransferase [Desulfobacterales bacterium]
YLEKIRRLSPLKALQLSARGGTDKEFKALGTAAANPAIPPQARAALGLALASALQKKGDHGPAMDHALRANALFRTFIPHDARARAAHNDEIMALMSDRFFSRCRGFGISGGLPLFILGMPRSGTTLVEQILGGHSRVFAGGELDPIPRMWRRLAAWENRLGSAFRGIPRAVLELTRDQSRQFARKVDQEYRDLIPKDTGADMITDKLPHNFQNIGLIKLLYPRARIIYCRRHPGGIALSNFFTDYKARHGGMGFAYDLEGIRWEIAGCRRLMAHWDRLFPGQIQVVDYETLVKDPQATVRTLLGALGLDWEPGVMDFTRLERPVKTASLKQVRRPLYTGAATRWQHYRQGLAPMFRALEEGLSAGNPDLAPLPDHPPGMFLRAMGRLEAGDLQAAETLFKEILDRYPRHAAAIHMLGAGFARQGKLDLACRNMKRSIELHPGNPTWYDNLANVLEGMGKTEEARAMRETLPRHLADD